MRSHSGSDSAAESERAVVHLDLGVSHQQHPSKTVDGRLPRSSTTRDQRLCPRATGCIPVWRRVSRRESARSEVLLRVTMGWVYAAHWAEALHLGWPAWRRHQAGWINDHVGLP
jgi:hypothetical protein